MERTFLPTLSIGSAATEEERQFRAEVQRAFHQLARNPTAARLESLTLHQDSSEGITATLVGGLNVQSAVVLIDDNDDFSSPLVSQTVSIVEGQQVQVSTGPLTGSQRGKTWYAKATPFTQPSAGGQAGTPHTASVYVSIYVPTTEEVFFRIGDTATLILTVNDPMLRVNAVEFNKREGDNSATGWVSSWDSSSGTVGVHEDLTRQENVSIPDGKDSEIAWRVKYTDERGEPATVSNTLNTANLRQITKTLRLPYASFHTVNNTMTWNTGLFGSGPGALSPNDTNLTQFDGSVVLPIGVILTRVTVNCYRETTSDAATFTTWSVDNSGGSLLTALATHSTTGWQQLERTLSHVVLSNEVILIRVALRGVANAANAKFMWAELEYIVPDYAKTI